MRVLLILSTIVLASVNCENESIGDVNVKRHEKRGLFHLGRIVVPNTQDSDTHRSEEYYLGPEDGAGVVQGITMTSGFVPSFGYAHESFIPNGGSIDENAIVNNIGNHVEPAPSYEEFDFNEYNGKVKDNYLDGNVNTFVKPKYVIPQNKFILQVPHNQQKQQYQYVSAPKDQGPTHNSFPRPIVHHKKVSSSHIKTSHPVTFPKAYPNKTPQPVIFRGNFNGDSKIISVSGGYSLGGSNNNWYRKGLVSSVPTDGRLYTRSNEYNNNGNSGSYLSSSLKPKTMPGIRNGYPVAYSQLNNLLNGAGGSGSSLYFAHNPSNNAYSNYPKNH